MNGVYRTADELMNRWPAGVYRTADELMNR